MSFIEQAKEVLTSEEVAKLELLARKSADFETTHEEDNELIGLKKKVKEAIAQRDKEKNLAFVKEYTLIEILQVFKPTQDDLNKAIKTLFPKEKAAVSEAIAKYKIGDKVHEVKNGERPVKALSEEIQKHKEKGFVKALTDFGKAFMKETHVADAGPYAGETIYDSVNAIATRFKFNKAALLKELKAEKIITEEAKA